MKWFTAVAALLMVPTFAFGMASYTLTGNVGAQSGLTEVDINDLIAAGGAMSVNLGITTTADGCAEFDVALATSTDDAITMTGRSVYLTYFAAFKSDQALFTDYRMLKTSALEDQNLGGYNYEDPSWWWSGEAQCMTVDLQVDTAAVTTAGFPYAISIASPGSTGLHIADDSIPPQDIYDGSIAQVLITPEPASLLLMIGALPILRRRSR